MMETGSPRNGSNDAGEKSPGGFWDGLNRAFDRLGEWFREGNRRRFVIRDPQGRDVLAIPLGIAVLLGLLLLWRLPFLVILVVIVALVMKIQFVVTRESGRKEAGDH